MGKLVEDFGGKSSGELIKASDWNGMLTTVEDMFDALSSELTAKIDVLETRATDLEARADTVEARLNDAEATLDFIRSRMHRLELSTNSTRFAIGQRGVISAQVTSIDGNPLDLSNPATRPWIDFVTVWGTLKAASGFISRGGAGDKTLSVQVNSEGIAQVLIRADHAELFAEEEELEIEGFLSTQPQAGSSSTIGDIIMAANTPHDASMNFAYKSISTEYDRTITGGAPVFQRYIDAYYIYQPSRAGNDFASIFTQRWRDYRATVMAFLKPDSDPTTADGAMASASIQVTFRDWIAPWVVTDYLPFVGTLQLDYGNRFRNLLGNDLFFTLENIGEEVKDIIGGKGLIGRQRDFLAIEGAVAGMKLDTDPPPFMNDLIKSVQFGSQVQHALYYSQAVTPGSNNDALGFGAVSSTNGRAASEAGAVRNELEQSFDAKLSEANKSLKHDVAVAQSKFKDELLQDNGPILSVQRDVQAFSGQIENFKALINNKADVELITNIIGTLPG